jgi:hypothetical protein
MFDLKLTKDELFAVWDALQQAADNSDGDEDVDEKVAAQREVTLKLVAAIEERLVPAMLGDE